MLLATHPSLTTVHHDAHDEALIASMAEMMAQVARGVDPETCSAPPYVNHGRHQAGHVRRIVLYQRPQRFAYTTGAFVGFIGKKRSELPAYILHDITAVDEQLMDAFVGVPDLQAYASIELPDSNWCNLVLFRSPEATALVHKLPEHRHAAQELAPRYYEWIRLYHGVVANGLLSEDRQMTVDRMRQYSF